MKVRKKHITLPIMVNVILLIVGLVIATYADSKDHYPIRTAGIATFSIWCAVQIALNWLAALVFLFIQKKLALTIFLIGLIMLLIGGGLCLGVIPVSS